MVEFIRRRRVHQADVAAITRIGRGQVKFFIDKSDRATPISTVGRVLNSTGKSLKLAAAAAALSLLSACSWFGMGDGDSKRMVCPGAAILGDAEKVTQFKSGTGRDLTDKMFEAEIRNLRTTCKHRPGRLIVDMTFELVATRFPAAKSREGDFSYFIAVTDKSGRVLAKETFNSRIAFAANRRRAGTVEETEQSIPLQAQATGADYEVLVGFQLSANQLQFNRRK